MKKLKIYVAGKLNDYACEYLSNVHKMIKTARMLREHGFAVYVPCNDLIEGVVDGEFQYKDYFDNSQPWLLSSDAVFLVPGWETSEGTNREKKLAEENGIPVFDSIDDLLAFSFSLISRPKTPKECFTKEQVLETPPPK